MNVLAFALCIPLGKVIAATLDRPPVAAPAGDLQRLPADRRRLCARRTLRLDTPCSRIRRCPTPHWPSLIIQSQYNFILFLLWSAFCSAILYAAQLQERERSLLEAQVLAREAELKMLRYQINPHFLFNTLNAVSALIVTGQALAAEAMVSKLARFFRNALSRESTAKVTLAEELRVQLEYLNIELTRFPDRLSWSTQIEPGLENALVPHLILQPLFENAIKHGVARTCAPVEFEAELRARRNGQLVVTVLENEAKGVGLKPDLQRAGGGRRRAHERGATACETSMERAPACRSCNEDGRFIVELRLPIELTL